MTVLVLTGLLLGTPGARGELTPPTIPIPREYFGIHTNEVHPARDWPSRVFGSWRLLEGRVKWEDLEPARNVWKWGNLEAHVDVAREVDVNMLVSLGFPPRWAARRQDARGIWGPADTSEPRDIADWTRYVETVATRYRDDVRNYELWNEVNPNAHFYTGSPEALAELQRTAYETLKRVDPGITFVAPSVTGLAANLQWYDAYLGLGTGRYADVIGWHFYSALNAPDDFLLDYISQVRAVLRRHGVDDKPLWNTESGYHFKNGWHSTTEWPALEEDIAAAYVTRALVVAWVAGVDRFYWYSWWHNDLGFVRPDGSLIPAAASIEWTARTLTGSVIRRCSIETRNWICELSRDGRRAWLVWNADDTAQRLPRQRLPGVVAAERFDRAVAPLDAAAPIEAEAVPVLYLDQLKGWNP